MQIDNNAVQNLTGDGEGFEAAWSEFLFNTNLLKTLKDAGKESLSSIVTAGLRFQGQGWSTLRASRRLWDLTGIAMVKGSISAYRDVWLYTICLWGDLDVNLELGQDQSDAAFALAQSLDTNGHFQDQPEEDSDREDVRFNWDEPEAELPRPLQELWRRAEQGTKRVDLKRLLDSTPRYAGLPARAPENNLGAFGKSRQDRFLRQLQQSLLHVLRLGAAQYDEPDGAASLQCWQYVSQLYWKIQEERKDLSVPGLVKDQQQEVLFSKEDVLQQKSEVNLQRMRMSQFRGQSFTSPRGCSFRAGVLGKGSFRPRFGYKGQSTFSFKGKGQPFGGKAGRPSWSSWTAGRGKGKGFGGKGQGVPFSVGYGSPERIGKDMASVSRFRSPIPCSQKASPMVGKTCSSPGSASHQVWCGTGVFSANTFLQTGAENKGGHFTRNEGNGRVRAGGGSQGSLLGGDKSLGSLVRYSKGGRTWKGKTSPHLGLQGDKSVFGTHSLSFKPLERHLPCPQEGHVGCESGS